MNRSCSIFSQLLQFFPRLEFHISEVAFITLICDIVTVSKFDRHCSSYLHLSNVLRLTPPCKIFKKPRGVAYTYAHGPAARDAISLGTSFNLCYTARLFVAETPKNPSILWIHFT